MCLAASTTTEQLAEWPTRTRSPSAGSGSTSRAAWASTRRSAPTAAGSPIAGSGTTVPSSGEAGEDTAPRPRVEPEPGHEDDLGSAAAQRKVPSSGEVSESSASSSLGVPAGRVRLAALRSSIFAASWAE